MWWCWGSRLIGSGDWLSFRRKPIIIVCGTISNQLSTKTRCGLSFESRYLLQLKSSQLYQTPQFNPSMQSSLRDMRWSIRSTKLSWRIESENRLQSMISTTISCAPQAHIGRPSRESRASWNASRPSRSRWLRPHTPESKRSLLDMKRFAGRPKPLRQKNGWGNGRALCPI